MQFHYLASQEDGRIIEDQVEAKDVSEVLQILVTKRLKPVSIKPVVERGKKSAALFGGKITLTDQVFLSKYLALMLKIGTGLLQAINILIEDFDKPVVKSFLLEVKANLERGQTFFSTFAKYPRVFSQVYINLIRAGEASGNLDTVFENLTKSLAKEKEMHDQVRSALIYPILLLSASVLILIFLVMFALPKIAGVFSQSGF